MPQIDDFQFYLVPNPAGKYTFGSKNKIRGDIYRRPGDEWSEMLQSLKIRGVKDKDLPVKMYAIAEIKNVRTDEICMVYEVFDDLKEGE